MEPYTHKDIPSLNHLEAMIESLAIRARRVPVSLSSNALRTALHEFIQDLAGEDYCNMCGRTLVAKEECPCIDW